MPLSLDDEIRQINDLKEVKQVRDKRASRKGIITRLGTYIHSLDTTLLSKLRVTELRKKLDETQRSVTLYSALQERFEQLSLGHQDYNHEDEQSQAAIIHQDNELLVEHIESKIQAVNLYNQGTTLRDAMDDFMVRENLTAPSASTQFTRLQTELKDFRTESRLYEDDPTIYDLRQELRTQLRELSNRVASSEVESASTISAPSSSGAPASTSRSKMRIELPTFSGDPLDWRDFFQLFEALIARDPTLVDAEKACLLVNAMGTTEAKQVAQRASAGENRYDSAVDALKKAYGQDRAIFPSHVRAILKKRTYSHTRKDLREAREHWQQHIRGLKRCNGDTLEQFLATVLEDQFDPSLTHEWTVHSASLKEPPTVSQVLEFLETREMALPPQDTTRKPQPMPSHNNQKKSRNSVFKVDSQSSKCLACQDDYHPLFRCGKFLEWDQNRRFKFVKNNHFCSNCLSSGHTFKDCTSVKNCRICNNRHNSLLHRESSSSSEPSQQGESDDSPPVFRVQSNPAALLSTAIAMVSSDQREQKARALLDSGASLTLITEKLASNLKAQRYPERLTISGLAGGTVSKHYVNLTFCSVHSSQNPTQDQIKIKCHIVPELPPVRAPVNADNVLRLPCIKGKTPIADPQLGGTIDVLLGISDCSRCSHGDIVYSSDKATLAVKTVFGWTLGGAIPDNLHSTLVFKASGTEDRTDELLQRFWELEQVPGDSSPMSADELAAVTHFTDTHKVLSSGRFAVQLPRRKPLPELGESRSLAVRRFKQNERSLQRKGQLTNFQEVLQEYGTLDHAELVPKADISKPFSSVFYLPTHGVVKESSTTTKLRAVFDASAKSKSGYSLNDQLLIGPNIYPLLTTVLNRFRTFQVAMSADISKMFREIVLQEPERDFHRFLQKNSQGELVDWRMKRLTFGVASSPFLATQVLRQIAQNHKEQYPEAASIIETSFYVDDCLTGAETVDEAAALRRQLCELLQKAGMNLRKWRSNSPEFLKTVPNDLQEQADLFITDPSDSVKALGLHWDIKEDNFYVSVPSVPTDITPTKREVASSAARVFDLLGWYAPATLLVKIILQKLWSLHLNWDEVIPDDLAQQWREWSNQLVLLSKNSIPRRVFSSSCTVISRQLHGFADASSLAYGGVIYVRSVYSDANVSVSMVTAKTRVAPLKMLTIPKLELSAALLTARLLDSVASDLGIPTSGLYAWSDSAITLGWIQKAPGRWKTFVANRVTEIQDLVPPRQWRYVPTQSNPADHASRGLLPKELLSSKLWWHGPPWLSDPAMNWPSPLTPPLTSELPEIRATAAILKAEPLDTDLWHRYSSFTTLIRIVAWCRRFLHNVRTKTNRETSLVLTSQEISSSRTLLYKLSQQEIYTDALQLLRNGKAIPKANLLFCLSPHLSEDGLLRVGGRIQKSGLPETTIHPIILSIKSQITRLMLQTLHVDSNHSGPSTMLAILAENFYVTGAKRLCKAISRSCVVCQRSYAKTLQQQMGQLPVSRLKPSPPFRRVGIDFAGPFMTRRGNPRKPTKVKTYACLFVCMATRAVHIELCSELSTDAFLASFTRFCARRGTPSCVFTDNGTNFQGAAHTLEEMEKLLRDKTTQQRLSHLATRQQIRWHFSPSRAPHFGGLWEAAVRGMKATLRKILSPQLLTFEELSTVLAEAEASLNSRPLLPLDSTETDGPSALTPGHFLIGRPLKAPRLYSLTSCPRLAF